MTPLPSPSQDEEKMHTPGPWHEVRDALNKLRGLLDGIDDTPLGQVSKSLDEMARLCDTALHVAEDQL